MCDARLETVCVCVCLPANLIFVWWQLERLARMPVPITASSLASFCHQAADMQDDEKENGKNKSARTDLKEESVLRLARITWQTQFLFFAQ